MGLVLLLGVGLPRRFAVLLVVFVIGCDGVLLVVVVFPWLLLILLLLLHLHLLLTHGAGHKLSSHHLVVHVHGLLHVKISGLIKHSGHEQVLVERQSAALVAAHLDLGEREADDALHLPQRAHLAREVVACVLHGGHESHAIDTQSLLRSHFTPRTPPHSRTSRTRVTQPDRSGPTYNLGRA